MKDRGEQSGWNLERCFIQGASRGIGLGFVRRLLASDQVETVYATSRNPGGCEAFEELRARHGDRLVPLALDVTDEATIERAAQRVADDGGELDFLLNVTGVLHDESRGMSPEKSLRDIEPKHLSHAFAVNAIGPIVMAKHFHRFFRHGRRAVWANMSARVGSISDNHLGGWYGYRASKAAQNMFTRTMAVEMGRKAPETIVVALHPGTVDTGLSEPFQKNVPQDQLFTVERAVDQLAGVVEHLRREDHGAFFAWDGSLIEW